MHPSSTVATRNNYVKPSINERGTIQIKGGRHPVVEKMMRDDLFVANDTCLDNGKNRISIITGPNMAGKSTQHAPDCADRADGADRKLRAGDQGKHRNL